MSIAKSVINRLDAVLGRCQRCMRKSFIATVLAIFSAVVAERNGLPLPIEIALESLAFVCAALWLAHVVFFALRASRSPLAHSAETAEPEKPVADLSRRQLVKRFASAAAFALLATSVLSRTAAASCTQLPIQCTQNSDCTCSNCCANSSSLGVQVCQPSC